MPRTGPVAVAAQVRQKIETSEMRFAASESRAGGADLGSALFQAEGEGSSAVCLPGPAAPASATTARRRRERGWRSGRGRSGSWGMPLRNLGHRRPCRPATDRRSFVGVFRLQFVQACDQIIQAILLAINDQGFLIALHVVQEKHHHQAQHAGRRACSRRRPSDGCGALAISPPIVMARPRTVPRKPTAGIAHAR